MISSRLGERMRVKSDVRNYSNSSKQHFSKISAMTVYSRSVLFGKKRRNRVHTNKILFTLLLGFLYLILVVCSENLDTYPRVFCKTTEMHVCLFLNFYSDFNFTAADLAVDRSRRNTDDPSEDGVGFSPEIDRRRCFLSSSAVRV